MLLYGIIEIKLKGVLASRYVHSHLRHGDPQFFAKFEVVRRSWVSSHHTFVHRGDSKVLLEYGYETWSCSYEKNVFEIGIINFSASIAAEVL